MFSHPENKTQPVTFKQQCGVNVSRLPKLSIVLTKTTGIVHNAFCHTLQHVTGDFTNLLESHMKVFHT